MALEAPTTPVKDPFEPFWDFNKPLRKMADNADTEDLLRLGVYLQIIMIDRLTSLQRSIVKRKA